MLGRVVWGRPLSVRGRGAGPTHLQARVAAVPVERRMSEKSHKKNENKVPRRLLAPAISVPGEENKLY